jgi:2-C-methyl-D-erythritol 4-phosphate cytidylyltransferase
MVVVAAGASTRFGADKLMVEVEGRTLIEHTIDAVIGYVDVCVVVSRHGSVETVAALRNDITVVPGGATRTLSETAGLAAIGREVDLIGIHDAARPLVGGATIEALFAAAHAEGGALPLVPYEGLIVHRSTHRPLTGLVGAQTPQVFRTPDLMSAYVRAAAAGFDGHDTVEVVQAFSDIKIVGIQGDPDNVKVTFKGDLEEVRMRLSGPSRT